MFDLPVFVDIVPMACVLVVLLIVFHAWLVYWRPLDKRRWKQVDYVWLGVAAIGLFGVISDNRQALAQGYHRIAGDFARSRFELARSHFDNYASEGVVCRTFSRSEFSPPPEEFDRMVKEYDALCDWYRQVAKRFPRELGDRTKSFNDEFLADMPKQIPEVIEFVPELTRTLLADLDSDISKLQELKANGTPSQFDMILKFFGPILLLAALALRLTKVTGEIRLNS